MPARRPLSAAHESLGSAIREHRATADVSCRELASRSGLALERLERLERGWIDPDLGEMVAVARALGMRLADLVEPLE